MNNLPRLAVGQQSFEILRNTHSIYVDKTQHIYQLIQAGRFHFLSRPRRFGKSLLVSTLKCLFEGKQELFKDLWISQENRWNWEVHPVLFLDFSGIRLSSPEELKDGLQTRILRNARQYGIKLRSLHFQDSFQELIIELNEKTGKPVVVLVDEYDKPIVEHLGKGEQGLETAKANRDILKQLYDSLKDGDVARCLRFVFLTGISKFSRVSVFSGLNNLKDLTMNDRYSDLCGYTENELQHYFPAHLKAFCQKLDCSSEALLQQLAKRYNGYRFSNEGTSVYNPFSMVNAFDDLKIENYWFESGSPSFLINLLKEQNHDLSQIDSVQIPEEAFSTYDLEKLNPTALLFQTGYVTIKSHDGEQYTLGYPNQEVKSGFFNSLWNSYTEISNGQEENKNSLYDWNIEMQGNLNELALSLKEFGNEEEGRELEIMANALEQEEQSSEIDLKKKGVHKRLKRLVDEFLDERSRLNRSIKGIKHGAIIAQDIVQGYHEMAKRLETFNKR